MAWLVYFLLLFNLGCFIFVGFVAGCMEFIAEKHQREGSFAKRSPIGVEECVELCVQTDICFAVNYFRLNATCQFLNRTMPESKLVKAAKCLYKSVRGPPKESIDKDPCYQKLCPWDQICIHNTTTNLAECYPLCKTPPVKSGAIYETAEVELGHNFTYRCQDGLFGKQNQNPTVTCLQGGNWTPTNFTCVCKIPAKSGAINKTAEVEIGQNYTYRCEDNLFERGDKNPTVTCLHYGNWTSTNFICVKQNWTQDTIYPNNIHKSEVISNVTGIGLLACMQECDKEPTNCLSFFYDNHTSFCVLSSSFQRGLPEGFQLSDGLVYYTDPSTSCDSQYSNVILDGSYFCIKYHPELKSFNEAMKTCESEKAKLLVVTNKAQMIDLSMIWPNLSLAYIGVSDQTKEGRWVSWNGEMDIMVDPLWYPGHPDNQVNEDCALMLSNIGIYDVNCDRIFTFLCHKKHF